MSSILLTGANFVNKGAEAMLLTALENLSHLYPDASFIATSYARTHGTESEGSLSSLTAMKCRILNDPITPWKILSQILWIALPFPVIRKMLESVSPGLGALSECQAVIDLSGFALSDKRPTARRLAYTLEVLTASSAGKPFVAFTQAFGPFWRTSSRILAKLALSRISLLLIRGTRSLTNLESLKLKRLPKHEICADSAFLFESDTSVRGPALKFPENLPLVGLSPNINIARFFGPAVEKTNISVLVKICERVMNRHHCNLVLFCHESGTGESSDMYLLEQIYQRLDSNPRAILLRETLDASAARQLISKLEFLIASRFHALVGAIAVSTPFLGLAWAHKYFELAEEADVPEAAVDCATCTENEIIERFDSLWQNRDSMRLTLKASRERLRASAARAFELLKENISL